MRGVCCCTSLVALLLLPTAAAAQTRDPAAAEALFRQGREDVKRGDYKGACPKFAESLRLDPAPGTSLNLAQCEEKIGKIASAWQHYQEAADQLPPQDSRSAIAKQGLESVRRRVPKLVIRLAKSASNNVKVLRDDVELGAASLGMPLPVDPGKHVVIVRAPGRKDGQQSVSLGEGETQEIEVEPGAPLDTNDSGRVSTTSTTSGSSLRTVGAIVGGLGLVGLGLGTYFSLRAKSKDDDSLDYCKGKTCWDPKGIDLTNESRDAAKVATISFVAGGVALAVGVVLVLVSPSGSEPKERVSLRVSPLVGPGSIGVGAGGSW